MPDVALAAPNEAAAAAGERVALAGGNAVDAALAAALVTMVNEVGIVSLSSGGFVTVQPPDGTPYTVDGWMDMPGRGGRELGGGTWDVSTDYGGGVDVTIGPGSVATHGSVAAFGEVHARDGRLPWRELVAPAVDVARGGFALSRASRYYLDYVHLDIFGWDDASRRALLDEQGHVTTGLVLLPELVDSLEEIARVGPSALHTGDLARRIADDVLERGGILGHEDLAAYAPVVRPSLSTRIGPWTLATTPPPSVGGVCVAAMLRLLEDRPRGPWTPEDVAHLVRVQRAVLGHRLDVLDHTDDVARAAAAFLAQVDRDHLAVLESGSTAHVSAADSDGLACSVTVSSGYGAGFIAAGTGIWLNNCLGEQELNPRGLHGLAPGTRLLSNMAPTVGRHDDGSALAIGSPGADRITTAITQVLAAYVSGGLSLRDAVDHPRVHLHRAGRPTEELKVESELTMYFGGVGAAVVGADGRLSAAADPRREGAVRLVTGR
ncbi:gamma-glutamyltransferase [Nocardioides lijunqiniae]|uniref:gamma-glutamyltransferase n=1 Tax=Nocardioides lijunqiniae TaxID=2760832 RepID=UPI0030B85B4E